MGLDMELLDSTTNDILREIIPSFHKGVAALDEMTSKELGLRYSMPCKESNKYAPNDPSIHTNAQALWAFQELEEDLRESRLKVGDLHQVEL